MSLPQVFKQHVSNPVNSMCASWLACADGQNSLEPKKARLLALTEWGNVSLWSVHVLTSSQDVAGTQSDAGLQFGGKVRLLLLAASLPMGRNFPAQAAGINKRAQQLGHAAALALPPSQVDQFIVAGDNDCILRGSLYGQAPVPKVHRCQLEPCQHIYTMTTSCYVCED